MPKKTLKQTVKEALVETLREQRGLFREVVREVLEDIGMTEAIRKGLKTKPVSRDEVFRVLNAKP